MASAKKNTKVNVQNLNDGENNGGEWFSAIVVQVVPNPRPGSDEISQAAGDSWVGKNGYLKPNGEYQLARAFIGTVKDKNGQTTDEVFVVDIPNEINIKGNLGPLEGTLETMPAPPMGAIQRRLTYTSESKYPGCKGIIRSALSGENLAYLAYDSNGIKQVFTLPPKGGIPTQITEHKSSVSGGLRWHPLGKSIFYLHDGKIVQCKIGQDSFNNRVKYLTSKQVAEPTNIVLSHDGKTLAFNRHLSNKNGQTSKQIFLIDLL